MQVKTAYKYCRLNSGIRFGKIIIVQCVASISTDIYLDRPMSAVSADNSLTWAGVINSGGPWFAALIDRLTDFANKSNARSYGELLLAISLNRACMKHCTHQQHSS